MTEIWIQVFLCVSLSVCQLGSSYQSHKLFNTESECRLDGVKMLQNGGAGMKGKLVLCLNGTGKPYECKPKDREEGKCL